MKKTVRDLIKESNKPYIVVFKQISNAWEKSSSYAPERFYKKYEGGYKLIALYSTIHKTITKIEIMHEDGSGSGNCVIKKSYARDNYGSYYLDTTPAAIYSSMWSIKADMSHDERLKEYTEEEFYVKYFELFL